MTDGAVWRFDSASGEWADITPEKPGQGSAFGYGSVAVDPAHPDSVLACATPVATAIDAAWVAEEGSVARHAGAAFVDPTVWVCPTGPCPAVIGRYIVYRDTHHLATPFVAALASRLRDRLPAPVGPSPAAPTVASPTARP